MFSEAPTKATASGQKAIPRDPLHQPQLPRLLSLGWVSPVLHALSRGWTCSDQGSLPRMAISTDVHQLCHLAGHLDSL